MCATLRRGVSDFSSPNDDAKFYSFIIIEFSGTSKLLSSKYNQGHDWLTDTRFSGSPLNKRETVSAHMYTCF